MRFKIAKLPLLALLTCLLGLGSCSQPEPIIVYGLTLAQRSVVFDAEGGTKLLAVAPFPEDEKWTLEATTQPDWVTLKATAQGVEVTAQPNTSAQVREASFSLVSPDGNFDPYKVEVSQEAATLLEWSTSATDGYKFDSEGGQVAFVVVANAQWSAYSDSEWLTVECNPEEGKVILNATPNTTDEPKSATLTLTIGEGEQMQTIDVAVEQDVRANNPYYKLVGQWEISAAKWFYSPNGSLNSLDYAPNPNDYYLIFDIAEGEYGKTLVMKDFLYPGTEMEVRYNSATGGFVVPFGWSVFSYNVFFYITLVSDRQFSYAAYEVDVVPSEEGNLLTFNMPSVSGFNYVGFGLWTYDEEDNKIAMGSNYRPTMFPMAPITLKKQEVVEATPATNE